MTQEEKAEVILDAGVTAIVRGAEAIGWGGFFAFALAAAFCTGMYVAAKAADLVAGRWSR